MKKTVEIKKMSREVLLEAREFFLRRASSAANFCIRVRFADVSVAWDTARVTTMRVSRRALHRNRGACRPIEPPSKGKPPPRRRELDASRPRARSRKED